MTFPALMNAIITGFFTKRLLCICVIVVIKAILRLLIFSGQYAAEIYFGVNCLQNAGGLLGYCLVAKVDVWAE